MRLSLITLRLTLVLALICVPLSLFAADLPKLAAPPVGERWFSVNLSGERVGYAHQTITPAGEGYRIETDGSVKMSGLGFSRNSATRESYLVGRDLAIKSFNADTRIEGGAATLKGEAIPAGIKVTVQSGGKSKERILKVKGAVFPSQALNIYPLLQGAAAGKKYKLQMLDVEAEEVKIKQVKVEVIGPEKLPDGTAVVHLQNNLFPVVDNDIWVDLKGNTVKESVRDDMVLTLAEGEASARSYLADISLYRTDMSLDFSLLRVAPPLERPAQLKKLSVEFAGFPQDFPLLQGKGQQATRLPNGTVRFSMPNPGSKATAGELKPGELKPGEPKPGEPKPGEPKPGEPKPGEPKPGEPKPGEPKPGEPKPGEQKQAADLESTQRIPSNTPEIVAKKDEIVGAEKNPAAVAKLLVEWVAKEIKGTVAENQSPQDALKSRSGNSQTHTRLYAALAHAAGIPTRVVSGLVYSAKGFIYQSWAESNLNGAWVPVDPTRGEAPADLTHIELAEGEMPEDMGILAGVIGRLQAKVVEQEHEQGR